MRHDVVLMAILTLGMSLGAVAASAANPASSGSYVLDTSEAWGNPGLAFGDIRAASVERIDSQFRFSVIVHGVIPPQPAFPCSFQFELMIPGAPQTLVLAVSTTPTTSVWQLTEGHLDEGGRVVDVSTLPEDWFTIEEQTITLDIPAARLGFPASFRWSVSASMQQDAAQPVTDRAPQDSSLAFWTEEGSVPACTSFQLGIWLDKEHYSIGDSYRITILLSMAADIQIAQTGFDGYLWSGELPAGFHDVMSLVAPSAIEFFILPPAGEFELTLRALTASGCEGVAVASFTVSQ